MPVAKSYQNLEIAEAPYQVNGRMYCKVRQKTGALKQVRWYTDAEYIKMYPEAKATMSAEPAIRASQREVLGFQKGYITIFKGDTYSCSEWFKRSIARYCKWWGWYIVSTDEVPADLPIGITPIQLPWEAVGNESGNLIADTLIAKAIESYLYDETTSKHVGNIGDRLDLMLTIKKAIEVVGAFGSSTLHVMEDECGNEFVWSTSAKTWAEGSTKHVRGTVKDHRIYRNSKQTVLTRCMEV
jgi:hypothetical protein